MCECEKGNKGENGKNKGVYQGRGRNIGHLSGRKLEG